MATTQAIPSGSTVTVMATLKDASGVPATNTLVTFTNSNTALAIMTPANGTTLTNASGTATITLTAGASTGGAGTLTANAQVRSTTPGVSTTLPATGFVGYAVGQGALAPVLDVTLTQNGVAISTIPSGSTVTAIATLKNVSGAPVKNAVVTFVSADPALVTMTPANGTALTNDSGIATITLTGSAATAGATTLTANAQITTVTAGVSTTSTVTGSVGYVVGNGAAMTVSSPTFGTGISALSAYGTTSVSVTVASGGVPVSSPQLVTFASTCAANGKAVVSPPVYTLNGVATASYRDNGCAGADVITASVAGIISSPGQLIISAPSAGSIQFVSATPPMLALQGTGGKETSVVVFKVVDVGGNPISGKTVTFHVDNNAIAGRVTLTPTPSTAISDSNGLVQIVVNSGPVSTPVRVAASTTGANGVILNSTSNALSITTGIPDNDSFSLSASTFNIEGWSIDGTPTTLTIRASDHFRNPVPDGTPINFFPEGGSVSGTSNGIPGTGSCSTVGGVCSVTLTSQEPRPRSGRNGYGRVTVLAYAEGEEGFTDYNGTGWADQYSCFSPSLPGNEMVDASGRSTDLSEAWRDDNEDGIFNPYLETFIDFNNNMAFDGPDCKYSGVLCDDKNYKDPLHPELGTRSYPGSCAYNPDTRPSGSKTIHVRASQVIVFSSSFATIAINGGLPIALPVCDPATGKTPLTFTVAVVDENGNAMPVGTTIAFTSDNGTVVNPASVTVPNTIACRDINPTTGLPFHGVSGCPASALSPTLGDIAVTMKSDATYTAPVLAPPAAGKCDNANGSTGTLTVTVTAPSGAKTIATMNVTD